EKVLDLIRTLPKPLRVNVVPAPDFARRAVNTMRFGQGDLVRQLAAALGKATGLPIPADAFRPEELPDYLKMNLRIVDAQGKRVAVGRDIVRIRHELRHLARETFALEPPAPFNRSGIKTWDFADLPERVELRHAAPGQASQTLQGFPAVRDDGDSVSLRLVDSREQAIAVTRQGVRRLFLLDFDRELRAEVAGLPALHRMAMHYKAVGQSERLRHELLAATADRLFAPDAGRVRTAAEFEQVLLAAWNRFRPILLNVAATAETILARRHALTMRLDAVKAPLLSDSVADMRDQLARLVPPDFLTATPATWLDHVPRYLAGIDTRLSKLLNAGLGRDLNELAVVRPLWQAYLAIQDADDVDELARTKLRWMLEELRVQRFAQELGTSVKVSVKRVEAQLEQCGGVQRV
ncbi:MAG: DUF3418 domain-containing protein, partial [Phycisphaerae bacterium]